MPERGDSLAPPPGLCRGRKSSIWSHRERAVREGMRGGRGRGSSRPGSVGRPTPLQGLTRGCDGRVPGDQELEGPWEPRAGPARPASLGPGGWGSRRALLGAGGTGVLPCVCQGPGHDPDPPHASPSTSLGPTTSGLAELRPRIPALTGVCRALARAGRCDSARGGGAPVSGFVSARWPFFPSFLLEEGRDIKIRIRAVLPMKRSKIHRCSLMVDLLLFLIFASTCLIPTRYRSAFSLASRLRTLGWDRV